MGQCPPSLMFDMWLDHVLLTGAFIAYAHYPKYEERFLGVCFHKNTKDTRSSGPTMHYQSTYIIRNPSAKGVQHASKSSFFMWNSEVNCCII